MECKRVVFSGHALQRMFQRGIGRDAVLETLARGDVIAEYADDEPYPSRLLLGSSSGQPLHVVVAFEERTGVCVIVTVYEPSPGRWEADFRTRKVE